jgi:hypothetical protein
MQRELKFTLLDSYVSILSCELLFAVYVKKLASAQII